MSGKFSHELSREERGKNAKPGLQSAASLVIFAAQLFHWPGVAMQSA
jgi:hypothetical protein